LKQTSDLSSEDMESSIHDFLGKVEAEKDREDVKQTLRNSSSDVDMIKGLL
jgi:hypothetical protein